MGIYGRPAVTSRRVLASAQGKVQTLDLKTYSTSQMGLASIEGLLGNLVSADGKLISASMLGLCTYFSYDVAREELSRRIALVPPEERAGMLRQRAQLAFDSQRFDKALEDLKACGALLKSHKDTQLAAELGHLFCRTYVALGNHAASDAQMEEMFLKALSYASTKQQDAHMKLRLAKYQERVGQYARAAELAQEIADKYADQELVEVEIGPGADDSVRFEESRRRVRGDRLARDYIQGLLEKYGRQCYAKFDAEAKGALDKARGDGQVESILDVAKRWPNSQWADDALFAAAEVYYDRARTEEAKADDYLAEARRHLYRVARMPDSPLRVSASVALAMIYARGGWKTSARKECDTLRELDGGTQVAFADVRGKLGDVLKLIEGGSLGAGPRLMREISAISPPLAPVFEVKGDDVLVLRDQELRPVRLGEKVVILKDTDAYLLDTTADSQAKALAEWKGLAGVDKAELQRYANYPPGMRVVGGLSKDRRVLAVADRKSIRGLDLISAKVVWARRMEEIGIQSFYAMGVGSGVLVVADRSGKVSCVDIATGKLLWESSLVGGNRSPVGPPRIAGDMVLFRHNSGRTVTCLHLARGGRVAEKWEATRWSQCEVTPDGLLVMMLDGELTVRELGKLDKPLWRRSYDASTFPAILAVSSDRIAVSPSNAGGPVEVLSIPAGGNVATLSPAALGGSPAIPFDARFEGEALYVLSAPALSGQRKSIYGRLSSSRGLNLQKFHIPDEKRQWSLDLDGGKQMYYPSVPPIVVGREHVVVLARHYEATLPYHAYVVDAQTGKSVQQIDLRGRAAVQDENRRRQGTGPPVMTNGRLCVESSEGVTVYGER
jgi:tetratricopeptide (TPR) repeat protein